MSEHWLEVARRRYVEQLGQTLAATEVSLREIADSELALPRERDRARRMLNGWLKRQRAELPALRRQVGLDAETEPPLMKEGSP